LAAVAALVAEELAGVATGQCFIALSAAVESGYVGKAG
jgi:hypothetical protein